MRTKWRIAVAVAFTLLAGAAFAAPKTEYRLSLNGALEVGPDGSVRSYAIDGDTDAAAKKMVEAAVAKWRFQPIVRDGKPVIARTTMRLSLRAVPTEHDMYQLRLTSASFGEAVKLNNRRAPKYPDAAARAHLGARVLLVMDVGADGVLRNVGAYQTSLDSEAPNEHVAERWRRLFERASILAARHWTFERTDGNSAPLEPHQYMVPVEFRIVREREDENKPRWMATVPGPTRAEPWMHLASLRADAVDGLPDGAAVALDSDFTLLSDVIGKTL
ncbi:MAG TPA: hypothetical protein VFS55_14315 [Dokdonella sp.]|nr:hypothetical protein [Dokdonella sp.]